ncbi:MAG: glutamate racemase [Thermodesulfobacteriota bacterium]
MIGIFDSGVGGMTVARAVEQVLPGQDIVYLGDVARAPYGSKSPQTLQRYACQNTEFLLDKGAQLIIVACNSAASVAADLLKERYQVPIIEVISPAVASAVQKSAQGRIGVMGTRATINSGIYEKKIAALRPAATVLSQACPLLVPLVEEGWLHKRETKMIIRRYLQPLKARGLDTLILGCTHYPLLRDLIAARIGARVQVIDSSHAVARTVASFLKERPGQAADPASSPSRNYYVSDETEAVKSIARLIFARQVELHQVAVGG